MNYTPGPWDANVGQDQRGWLVGPKADGNDFMIAPVALLSTAFRREPEASANARLIAASPTMCTQLKMASMELARWLEVEDLPVGLDQELRNRLLAVNAVLKQVEEP